MSAVLKIKIGGYEVNKYFQTQPTVEGINKSLVDFKVSIDSKMLYALLNGCTINLLGISLNYEDIYMEEYK